MQFLLTGDNAGYLARYWHSCHLVDSSDDQQTVELFPKPNSTGADALYDSYLLRLKSEAEEVGVTLTIHESNGSL